MPAAQPIAITNKICNSMQVTVSALRAQTPACRQGSNDHESRSAVLTLTFLSGATPTVSEVRKSNPEPWLAIAAVLPVFNRYRIRGPRNNTNLKQDIFNW